MDLGSTPGVIASCAYIPRYKYIDIPSLMTHITGLQQATLYQQEIVRVSIGLSLYHWKIVKIRYIKTLRDGLWIEIPNTI